jgi:hypothetical protein
MNKREKIENQVERMADELAQVRRHFSELSTNLTRLEICVSVLQDTAGRREHIDRPPSATETND